MSSWQAASASRTGCAAGDIRYPGWVIQSGGMFFDQRGAAP